jgi:hypothetical protein
LLFLRISRRKERWTLKWGGGFYWIPLTLNIAWW